MTGRSSAAEQRLGLIGGRTSDCDMDADVPNLDRPRAVTLDTPLRILIADDDELLSEMMTLQLAEAGCEVHCVADGRLALAAIEDSSFDVLITDWQMPNLDGINLVRHLRTYPPSNYMHIIMMTTRAAQRTVQEALAVEVDAFLYKPIDQTQLELGLGSARRIVSLERRLRRRNHHLAAAHARTREAYDRIKKDLDAAAEVQRGILPQPNLSGDFRHAAMFLPCYDLGGDSYNVVALGEDKYLFFLVDVCGHGVQAALRSFLIHHQLSALAPATPEELTAAALQLNELAVRDGGDSYFTMVCGILDCRDQSAWLLRAGHPFPLILDGDAAIELDDGGPPIGLLPSISHPVNRVDLSGGRRLLLYSDGIPDCADQSGQHLGQAGLQALAVANGHKPLGEFVASLERHLVSNYRGARGFEDDLSLLAIECTRLNGER
ncbi:PP2C family protein-serine/threonine phosphatase [Rhizorhabdus histidinilytica]|nr:SpoIIE family protein phosphatase [Rhizorhabdus histidinilytica]